MTKFSIVFMLLFSAFLSQADSDLQRYLLNMTSDDVSNKSAKEKQNTALREKILKTEAFSLGLQGGRYSTEKKIQEYLEPLSDDISRIADFSTVVIRIDDFVLMPPVITEVNYRSNITNDKRTIHSVGQTFRIIKEPRFTHTIPTWRNYVYFQNKSKPALQPGHPDLKPKNSSEIALWQEYVLKGWDKGVEKAYEAFEIKITRLVKEIQGMDMYHILLSKNMVTEPIFDRTELAIRGNENLMAIDNVSVTVKVNPRLNSQMQNWKVVPRMPDIKELFSKQSINEVGK